MATLTVVVLVTVLMGNSSSGNGSDVGGGNSGSTVLMVKEMACAQLTIPIPCCQYIVILGLAVAMTVLNTQ